MITSDEDLTKHCRVAIKKLGFKKMFMKFRCVIDVRKFLFFFINFEIKFTFERYGVIKTTSLLVLFT